jgi:hypothetical protein
MAIHADLKELLSVTFDRFQDGLEKEVSPEVYARLKFDFVFHMTDWQDDLAKLNDVLAHPEKWSKDEASDAVAAFLIHAPWHIQNAQRLLLADDLETTEAENLEPQPTRK